MKVNKNSRKGHLDIAKAIGLIIVLINHMELSLGGLNRYFGAFYVSEFFLLAGLTFRVKETETTKEFMIKKTKRLLLPYAGYSIFYLIWYGIERFFVESLRTDSLMLGSFKIAQIISILMVVIGMMFLVRLLILILVF